ncbi:hypothetical protein MJO28_012448 [Puccinia striiformis f. sp. tritici]|uniref:Uncharacterized protein n=1 Tax=Puccinia striiformis f. sp. tritici TaxID=168172 RepID=A0ACC0E1A3_9BASI|nr:hypothetical protein MJO28_012448 [Puccinia striiformis f. sp. tritici]
MRMAITPECNQGPEAVHPVSPGYQPATSERDIAVDTLGVTSKNVQEENNLLGRQRYPFWM